MKFATLLCWAALSLGVSASIGAPNAPSSRPQRSTKEEIPKLIAVLGDFSYAVRTEATKRLKLCDQGDLVGPLAEAYHQAGDVETKLRIREIARDVFLRPFEAETGFLGIHMQMLTGAGPNSDGRLGPKQNAILVRDVVPETAAELAGLKAGDLIIEIDGQPVPLDGTGRKFSKIISSHKAGEKVTLKLLRDRPFQKEVILGRKKIEYWRDAMNNADHEKIEKVEKKLRQWWREHFEPAAPANREPIRLPFPSIQ